MTFINKEEKIKQIIDLERHLMHSMRDSAPDAWLALDLTIAQLKTLLFIGFEEKTNFKTLASALGTTPPNVTGIVERMVEQDLINRIENPQNRRMQILSLTEKGRTLLRELNDRQTIHFSYILTSLTDEELSALERGLSALAKAADKVKGELRETSNHK